MNGRTNPVIVADNSHLGFFITREVRFVQPTKALSLTEVTLSGIVTEVKLEQLVNILFAIVVMLSILTEVKPVQPENAEVPTVVTLLEIVTEVKPVQP